MNATSIKTQILLSILFVESIFIAFDFMGFERSFWVAAFDILLGIGIAYILSRMLASSIESLTKKSIQFGSDDSVSFAGYDGSAEVCELSAGLEEMRKQIISKNKLIAAQLEKIDEYIITSTTDANGIIMDVSKAYCMICGYRKDELIGSSHNAVRHPDNSKKFFEALWGELKAGRVWRGEIKNKTKDSQTYWLDTTISPIIGEDGDIIGYYSISHDITAKKFAEELALTDPLTGLGNRRKLDLDFDELIKIYSRYKTPFSVIIADVDKFKSINDAYGHEIGDTVLKQLSKIIKKNVRTMDKVGRWGGEEFMILCPSTQASEALTVAQKLREAVEASNFAVIGKVTASFGVSSFADGDTVASCSKRADDALYKAKDGGRNRVEFE